MGTKNSNLISNMVASPAVKLDRGFIAGKLRCHADVFEVATGDLDAADFIRLARMKPTDRIMAIHIFMDDLDSGSPALTWDLGWY